MCAEQSLYDRLGGHAGILRLIKSFYADGGQHNVLAPVFNSHITDWPAHLEKIADFWALQAGAESKYRGGFAGAHMSLGLQAEHFQHWLGLWELNNARSLAPQEVGEMNAFPHRLASRVFMVAQR